MTAADRCALAVADLEAEVLRLLLREDATGDAGTFLTFHPLSRDLGLPRPMLSALLGGLRARGLVAFGRGLWRDDGQPAGAGYALTREGERTARDAEEPALPPAPEPAPAVRRAARAARAALIEEADDLSAIVKNLVASGGAVVEQREYGWIVRMSGLDCTAHGTLFDAFRAWARVARALDEPLAEEPAR